MNTWWYMADGNHVPVSRPRLHFGSAMGRGPLCGRKPGSGHPALVTSHRASVTCEFCRKRMTP